ncbi:MAG: cytochrome c oxidase subunit II [Nevskiales bacterium]
MTVNTVLKVAIGAIACLLPSLALAEWALNMPKGVTEVSRDVYDLHMTIFWVCVWIGVVVFGAMFYSVFAHRKSRHPKPADFHESTLVEIIWTVIPFVILVVMAIPAAGTFIRMEDSSNADMTVKITGYQWKWEYEYLDHDIRFFSTLDAASNRARQTGSGIDPNSVENYLLDVDNRLVVPVDTKVRFLLTSNDVIHAWWVPDLAVKKDAIPGFVNEMWTKIDEPGVYRGQCAELCGRDHGFMPVVIEALPQEEFDVWVAKQTGTEVAEAAAETATDAAVDAEPVAAEAAEAPAAEAAPAEESAPAELSKDELMAKGEEVYKVFCSACHKPDGSGMPPAFPAITGGTVTNGPVADHINQVLNGKGAMQPFGGQLNDTEIAAVITYQRNALGNSTGDIVQPADVAAAR